MGTLCYQYYSYNYSYNNSSNYYYEEGPWGENGKTNRSSRHTTLQMACLGYCFEDPRHTKQHEGNMYKVS